MDQTQKTQLCKLIHRTLKRCSGRDAIDTTERVADAVELWYDMVTEDSGVAVLTQELRQPEPEREAPWDIQENRPAPPPVKIVAPPPARNAVVPAAPRERSPIVLPGSPEFKETESNVAQGGVISAVDVRRRTGNAPGKIQAPVQEWTEGDLIDTILKNTPRYIDFETEGPEGRPLKFRVDQNVINLPGIGAQLTYKHDQVAQSDGFLIAKEDFSLFKREIDLNSSMDRIMAQLHGKYRYRDKGTLQPTMPAEVPLRVDLKGPLGDQAAIDGNNYQTGVVIDDPRGSVRADVARSNEALTPVNERPTRR